MPLFMDHHAKVGTDRASSCRCPSQGLETQGEYGVNYLKYWFDEGTGQVWCLVDAPDAAAAAKVHQEGHGLLADDLTPVEEGV